MQNAIESLGWQENTDDFFATIDCLVLPSEKESFGLVLIEAMAAQLPVIATRCNGPESIVLDKKTGLLVPVGDLDKLAQAISTLSNDSSLAKSLGVKGYERAQKFYTPHAVAHTLVASLARLGARFPTLGFSQDSSFR
jgi:glycosyltransferase involved in cell wall biosynthesis